MRILRPLLAAVQWKAAVAAGLAGLAAVEAGRALGHPPGSLMQTGRYSLILAAGCAALVIDDSAASTVAASPTPLSLRRVQRVVIGAVALAAGAIPVSIRAGLLWGQLPVRNEVDIALEVLVYAAFGCAGAAAAHRWGHSASAGIAGLSAVMVAFVTSAMLPRHGRLFPSSPFDPDARNRLLVNLALAGLVLVWASCDPGGRRRSRARSGPTQRARQPVSDSGERVDDRRRLEALTRRPMAACALDDLPHGDAG